MKISSQLLQLFRRLALMLLNQQRKRFADLDYILYPISGDIASLPEPRPLLRRLLQGEPPPNVISIEKDFRRIAEDPRPKGVVLVLRILTISSADLQSLRKSILRLREKGKRVICYAQGYDTSAYYLASAADEIIIQPSGSLLIPGLRQNVLYLKDALDAIGVQVESIQISPYKSAFEFLTNSDISPEVEAQINWLMDSVYETLTQDIAAGRGMTTEEVQQMVDDGLHTDEVALQRGYVDAALNEEDLVNHLGTKHIIPWKHADKLLFTQLRKPTPRYVAMLKVTGLIVPGESRVPPGDFPVPVFNDIRTGDLTLVQQVRRLMADDGAAAVILYIDSSGGDAMASEAMASTLNELAKTRPVIVYMNNVAASGGYYVATPARWIVAQPLTVTGSIGVIAGKANLGGVYQRLRINPIEYTRGANATLLSDKDPFTDEQRHKFQENIERTYRQFVGRVAASRDMSEDAVDAIAGGRVWTGQQAFENGLVDELGDLRTALDKARELANLPEHAPLLLVRGPKGDPIGPKLADRANPAAGLRYLHQGVRLTYGGRPQLIPPFKLELKI